MSGNKLGHLLLIFCCFMVFFNAYILGLLYTHTPPPMKNCILGFGKLLSCKSRNKFGFLSHFFVDSFFFSTKFWARCILRLIWLCKLSSSIRIHLEILQEFLVFQQFQWVEVISHEIAGAVITRILLQKYFCPIVHTQQLNWTIETVTDPKNR